LHLNKAVFLDRDGVLNKLINDELVNHARPPWLINEIQYFHDTISSVEKLHAANLMTIIVTNQPDYSRGSISINNLEKVQESISDYLSVTDAYACFHDNQDKCKCRKPKPGMLVNAAKKHGIDLRSSFMIGDRESDIIAGKKASCTTFLLNRNNRKTQTTASYVVNSLEEAVDIILKLNFKGIRTNED